MTTVTVEKILDVVTRKYGVTVDELKSKAKSSHITNPRQICMDILRKKTDLSLLKIGRIFNRDHSTVIPSVEKIEKEIKCNSLFEIEIKEIIEEIMRG